jgi:hypothetical protein
LACRLLLRSYIVILTYQYESAETGVFGPG